MNFINLINYTVTNTNVTNQIYQINAINNFFKIVTLMDKRRSNFAIV